MKKFVKIMLVVLGLSIMLVACGNANLLYESDGYTLEYPPTWQNFNETGDSSQMIDAVFMLLKEKNELEATLTVFEKNYKLEGDLENFVNQDIKKVEQEKSYEKIDLESFKVGDQKTFLHSFKADNGEALHYFMQVYVPSEEEMYILTAILPAEPESALLAEVKNIFRSFKLKSQNSGLDAND